MVSGPKFRSRTQPYLLDVVPGDFYLHPNKQRAGDPAVVDVEIRTLGKPEESKDPAKKQDPKTPERKSEQKVFLHDAEHAHCNAGRYPGGVNGRRYRKYRKRNVTVDPSPVSGS